MGKTSLMARTAERLRDEGVRAVVVDLNTIGHAEDLERAQWYYSILSTIADTLEMRRELRDFWEAGTDKPPLYRWVEALRIILTRRVTERLVVFIDEIDNVLALPFKTAEFFAAIRSCYNRRSQDPEFERITFCLLGVADAADLIDDPRLTPFNIGRRIRAERLHARGSIRARERPGR